MTEEVSLRTTLPLKLVVVICAGVLSMAGAWYHMLIVVSEIRFELRGLRTDMDRLVDASNGHIPDHQFRAWIRELRALNEDLTIPDME